MKRVLTLLLALALVFTLTACGGGQSAAPSSTAPSASSNPSGGSSAVAPVKIICATPCAENAPFQQAVYWFQNYVDEKLPGRVTWENHINGEMGSDREHGEYLLSNAIQMSVLPASSIKDVLPNVTAPDITSVPFLFQSTDELYAAMDGYLGDKMKGQYNDGGMACLTVFHLGSWEVLNNQRPTYVPSDLNGLKIRSFSNKGAFRFLEACGALPASIDMGETYTAIQQGTVSGLIISTYNTITKGFTDVTKYQTDLYIGDTCQMINMNLAFLESLPKDLHDCLIEAGVACEQHFRNDVVKAFNEQYPKDLASVGVELCTPTPEQYQQWVDVVSKYCWDEFKSQIDPQLWADTEAFLAEYRK